MKRGLSETIRTECTASSKTTGPKTAEGNVYFPYDQMRASESCDHWKRTPPPMWLNQSSAAWTCNLIGITSSCSRLRRSWYHDVSRFRFLCLQFWQGLASLEHSRNSAWQQISITHSSYTKSLTIMIGCKRDGEKDGSEEESEETLEAGTGRHPGLAAFMLFCHRQQLPNPASWAHYNLAFILPASLQVRDNQCHLTLIIVVESR